MLQKYYSSNEYPLQMIMSSGQKRVPCNRPLNHLDTLHRAWYQGGHDKNHRCSHHLFEHASISPLTLRTVHPDR